MKINVGKILWMKLASDENRFIRTLTKVRTGIRDAIGYREIQEMILTQQIPVEIIEKTQMEYAHWLSNELKEYYKVYGKAGFERIADEFQQKVGFDKVLTYVDTWVLSRGADLVSKICDEQKLAIRTILHKFIVEEPKSPEELSHYIRSVVGLTERQVQTLSKMRDTMMSQGMSEKDIQKAIMRSAREMHMFRARMIARTELSYAYNRGTLTEMQDIAREYGYTVYKVWLTAPDEFVCGECAHLNGKTVGLYDEFGMSKKQDSLCTPPLHPNCRCSLIYEVR